MIINPQKKFVFVHIQKTAGTSVATSLMRVSGSIDPGKQHVFVTSLIDPQRFYKFAFVRNPWDRLASWYNMMLKKGVHNSFSAYLLGNSRDFSSFLDCVDVINEENELETRVMFDYTLKEPYKKSIGYNQLDYICDSNGNVAVDFVGRFENIDEDFAAVARSIGESQLTLPHENRFDHADYRTYYSDADVEKVAKMYARDISYFGYSFQEPK